MSNIYTNKINWNYIMQLTPMEVPNVDQAIISNLLFARFSLVQIESLPSNYILQFISLLQSLAINYMDNCKELRDVKELLDKEKDISFSYKEKAKKLNRENLLLQKECQSNITMCEEYKDIINSLKYKIDCLKDDNIDLQEALKEIEEANVDIKFDSLRDHIDNLFLLGSGYNYAYYNEHPERIPNNPGKRIHLERRYERRSSSKKN